MQTNRHLMIVISGPSGVGKSTIIRRVLQSGALPSPIRFSVSATTRRPRPGEVDGVEYYFLSEDVFRRRADEGAFLEWANVHGALYGTPKEEVDKAAAAGADLLLELDVQGAASVRAAYPYALLIFLTISEEELRRRLHARESGLSPEELDAQVALRMRNMRKELEFLPQYDYVVENRELDAAVDAVVTIITDEKSRVAPRR